MNTYELVFIVDARLPDTAKSEISKQVTDLIARLGGAVLDLGVWIDRQRMAFLINKVPEGTYYLGHISMKGADVAKLRREMMINERILRFLIIRPETPKAKA